MSKRFVSYFDFLGFKDFILLNNPEDLPHRISHILRDVEHSLALDNTLQPNAGRIIANLNEAKINVHLLSDTVIFWTNDCSKEQYENWLQVSYLFNTKVNLYNFPARGCLYCGEMEASQGAHLLNEGSQYIIALPYGRALVLAHLKTQNQSWASTVIDNSVLDEVSIFDSELESITSKCTLEYVPYKSPPKNQEMEYVLRLIHNSYDESEVKFYSQNIERVFKNDNKRFDNRRVRTIFKNTVKLLRRQSNTYAGRHGAQRFNWLFRFLKYLKRSFL